MYANPAGIRQLRLPDKSSESYDYITVLMLEEMRCGNKWRTSQARQPAT